MANIITNPKRVICDQDSDRFVLHQHRDQISYGDLVWVTSTKLLYTVIDPTSLALTAGYALLASG